MFPPNPCRICSRASTKMRVLMDHRDEGSQLNANPRIICRSEKSARNPSRICSRASMKMRVLTDHRDEGSQLSPNPCRICSYEICVCNSFIFCSYKTLDLKSFRISSYEKRGYIGGRKFQYQDTERRRSVSVPRLARDKKSRRYNGGKIPAGSPS